MGGRGGLVAIDAGLGNLHECVCRVLARHSPHTIDWALLDHTSRLTHLADVRLLVVGRRDTRHWPMHHWIRDVRRSQPHLGIYLAVEQPGDLTSALREHALAGTDQAYAIASQSDRVALAEDALHRVTAPPPEVALRIIATRLPMDARAIAMWILRNSDRLHRPADIERHFGCNHRQVARLLAKHGLPPYRGLRELGVLLHAQRMRDAGCKGESIAAHLGLASGATLSRLLSRARRRLPHIPMLDLSAGSD